MPPKKKQSENVGLPPLIGRVGTNLKIGIVGVPNVGKSTFFNVLTKNSAPAENFPFCTINPNESRVAVPDERYNFLSAMYKPPSKVPAYLNVVDIAGLVKGAHEGQGLGNAFLSNIRACDAIFSMSRAFEDEEIVHVEGDVNPVRDLGIITEELMFKDLDYVDKQISESERVVQRGAADKRKKFEHDTLVKCRNLLRDGNKPLRFTSWDSAEIEVLNKHLFLTAKPVIYLVNLSERDYIRKKNKWLAKIKLWVDENDPGATIIPYSASLELRLTNLESDEERQEYLKQVGCTSALEKIIVTGYKALSLMYFFTVGEDEVKCWTIQENTKAPQAAGKIHTDFEAGFIMAEVMNYNDLKEYGSEAEVKAAGKYKQKGRDYIVHDGDVILFKFNAGAGLTSKKK